MKFIRKMSHVYMDGSIWLRCLALHLIGCDFLNYLIAFQAPGLAAEQMCCLGTP